jgi:hypothetical protein
MTKWVSCPQVPSYSYQNIAILADKNRMVRLIIPFYYCISIVLTLSLFFGCADAPSAETQSGVMTDQKESAGGSATSGAESAETDASQGDQVIRESNFTLPSWPAKAKVENGKAYPWDEGPGDPSFAAFRDRLYKAILEKDVKQLLAMTFDTIHFSYGENAGKANFIKAYELDKNPESSILWEELAEVLELGGAFYSYPSDPNRHFAAPFVYNLDLLEDPYTTGVIIGENVRLRKGPSLNSDIVGSLTWDIFESKLQTQWKQDTIGGEADVWQHLKTKNGKEGYVFGQFVRLPVDYRAGFREYAPGKWHMDFFIAGD